MVDDESLMKNMEGMQKLDLKTELRTRRNPWSE